MVETQMMNQEDDEEFELRVKPRPSSYKWDHYQGCLKKTFWDFYNLEDHPMDVNIVVKDVIGRLLTAVEHKLERPFETWLKN